MRIIVFSLLVFVVVARYFICKDAGFADGALCNRCPIVINWCPKIINWRSLSYLSLLWRLLAVQKGIRVRLIAHML